MPRLTTKELKKKLRVICPRFHTIEVDGRFYVGRWNDATMNSANQIGYGLSEHGALEEALVTAKSWTPEQKQLRP